MHHQGAFYILLYFNPVSLLEYLQIFEGNDLMYSILTILFIFRASIYLFYLIKIINKS